MLDPYDPAQQPAPTVWLNSDEGERIAAVQAWHRAAQIRLPNAKVHAVFHVIVENQIAEGMESVVRAMERLAMQGLDRHDSIHAIGWVLASHIHELFAHADQDGAATSKARYTAAVERLSAQLWRSQARS